MRKFKVFSERFSITIDAKTVRGAMENFYESYPDSLILRVEDITEVYYIK